MTIVRSFLPTFRSILVVALLLVPCWALPSALAAEPAETKTVLEIDFAAPATPVSPTLHGLMTEEINYSYDGGLYAELVRNRAFLDDANNEPVHWTVSKQAGAEGHIRVVNSHPLTDKLPNSLEVDDQESRRGQTRPCRQQRLLGHPRQAQYRVPRIVLCAGRSYRHRPQDAQTAWIAVRRPAHGKPRKRRRRTGLRPGRDAGRQRALAEVRAYAHHRCRRQADERRPLRDLSGRAGPVLVEPGLALSAYLP